MKLQINSTVMISYNNTDTESDVFEDSKKVNLPSVSRLKYFSKRANKTTSAKFTSVLQNKDASFT